MGFPDTLEDYRSLVVLMREHGVISACGVTLGPTPSRAVAIENAIESAAMESAPPLLLERLNKELAEERRRIRVEKAREDMRTLLAASGIDYTNEQLDKMIGPVA